MALIVGLLSFASVFAMLFTIKRRRDDPVRQRLGMSRPRFGQVSEAYLPRLEAVVESLLAQGGIDRRTAYRAAVGLLGLFTVLTMLGVFQIVTTGGQSGWVAIVSGGLLLASAPAWLYASVTRRLGEIERQLPLFAECLAIGLEAGATLEMSLTRMAPRMHGPLGDEVRRALGDLQLGSTRREALWSMARRVGLPELTTLVMTIVQSEELGAGFARVIRTLAGQMRARQVQRAERATARAPIQILFPLIFFIFPSLLVLMLGPLLVGKGVG